MAFPFPRLALALAAGSLATSSAAESVLAPATSLAGVDAPASPPPHAALKAAYHVRLTSTWPQVTGPDGCRNGGVETLEGTLARNADGTYAGIFSRNTELLFCGTHGTHGAPATSCTLTLEGRGEVAMSGMVRGDDTSPSGRSVLATWMPAEGHEAVVNGACGAGFKDAVKAMYLTTAHAVEFPLTAAGTGPRTERLENYAWRVDLD
ncbi:MAG: hypothetical protein ABIQ49_04415 [Gemmatimonadales bacterium]